MIDLYQEKGIFIEKKGAKYWKEREIVLTLHRQND